MNGTELILLWLALEAYTGAITFNFYKAAGRKTWEAFVPIYRVVILAKIIERPWWWTILYYLPVVGNVMVVVMMFELLHVSNFRPLKHTIFTIVTLGLYLGYLNFNEKITYVGRDIQDIRRHVSELAASLIFAVVAATAIRAYTFEAFTIPTPSMEKSLMVGDFLFVSKFHYGSRPPLTPLALPLVHNKIPFTGLDSYLDWIELPYWRFLKFNDVQRGDAVVFNYPAEDIRPINMDGKVRPIDKREHYVKRCVGIPGDTLSIVDREIMIDGEPWHLPEAANPQTTYYVETKTLLPPDELKEKYDIIMVVANGGKRTASGDVQYIDNNSINQNNKYLVNIPEKSLDKFSAEPYVLLIYPIISRFDLKDYDESKVPPALMDLYSIIPAGFQIGSTDIFPNPPHSPKAFFKWTRDNYGPIWIPKKGATIELNSETFLKYRRAITADEGNTLEFNKGNILLNGEPASTYTFKQDYYWMMGDNRHSSDDSRYWGFVPENHIVGKPVFIWMSWDKYGSGLDKIRFDRVFTVVHGEGPGRSYFWPFVIVVALIYGGNKFYQNRKKKAA